MLYLNLEDLANSHRLENHANTDGDKTLPQPQTRGKISPETGQAIGNVAGSLLAAFIAKPKNEQKQQIKMVCGRKPLFGYAKKQTYRKCVADLIGVGSDTSEEEMSKYVPADVAPEKSNKTLYWILGISGFILIGGVVTYVIIKTRKK
jgi:hypothetical protein